MRMHSHDQESRERDARNEADASADQYNRMVSWDKYFLGIAKAVAVKSKDPSTRVGCVIARPDNSLVSAGFNGFAKGLRDEVVLNQDRDAKLMRTVHAELNALMFAREPLNGYTMYTTLLPCANCMLHVIQAGITRLVTILAPPELEERWGPSFAKTKALMEEANVQGSFYHPDTM